MKFLPLTVVLLAITTPITVSAATFFAAENIAPETVIADDIYAAGDSVSINQAVEGDVFIAGSDINITGAIGGDIFTVGENIYISGEVTDDIMSAGNSIKIDTPAVGDVFVAALIISITPQTVITGDVFLAGDSVTISGSINGTVRVASSDVTVTEGTTITGDLISYGAKEPIIHPEANIAGETRHTTQAGYTDSRQSAILAWVQQVLATFAGAAVLLYAFPASSRRIIAMAVTRPTTSFGLGVAHLSLFIPVSLVLLMSILGMSLGFLTLAVTATFIIAGLLYAALLVGERIMTWTTKKPVMALSWQHALLGAVIMNSLGVIPIIGWLISTVLAITAIGAIGLVRWQELRKEDA